MDIVGIFKKSAEVSKKNYIIFVPTVAVAVVIVKVYMELTKGTRKM